MFALMPVGGSFVILIEDSGIFSYELFILNQVMIEQT